MFPNGRTSKKNYFSWVIKSRRGFGTSPSMGLVDAAAPATPTALLVAVPAVVLPSMKEPVPPSPVAVVALEVGAKPKIPPLVAVGADDVAVVVPNRPPVVGLPNSPPVVVVDEVVGVVPKKPFDVVLPNNVPVAGVDVVVAVLPNMLPVEVAGFAGEVPNRLTAVVVVGAGAPNKPEKYPLNYFKCRHFC
uniref:Uncharacterized protein n=1 Tax=Ascaris lumbricoides TaxID=6252 RepID=A0A0M3IWX6_ASCLU